jgi:hypothetical protein
MMMNNFYDDDGDTLPDWMLAETHRNPKQQFTRHQKTLTEAINDALRKPHVPIIIIEPRGE